MEEDFDLAKRIDQLVQQHEVLLDFPQVHRAVLRIAFDFADSLIPAHFENTVLRRKVAELESRIKELEKSVGLGTAGL